VLIEVWGLVLEREIMLEKARMLEMELSFFTDYSLTEHPFGRPRETCLFD